MMGERTVMQEALFYEFSLERHVPDDHLLRSIDRFVDLSSIREHLRPYYSDTGRPSIDPELMIRMLLIGYCLGIRSERRLCEEVHLNLAYRWFCRLGLDGAVPDHSTFSKDHRGHKGVCPLLTVAYGIEAYELARAMFIVLAREKGTGFADAARDELDRRQGVLAVSGHPWETSVAQTLLDMQLWDAWPEAGVSGTFSNGDTKVCVPF